MQDKAIAAIGEWQLLENKRLEPVDIYIENMFPGKDYQMLLLVFELMNNENILSCRYKGIAIENVGADNEDYLKFAYRKGTSRGGDITLSTKISSPVSTKIAGIKDITFKNIIAHSKGNDTAIFQIVRNTLIDNETNIVAEIDELFKNFSNDKAFSTGLSIKIIDNGTEKYLRDYDLIKEIIILSGATMNYIHAGTESRANNKVCSVSGNTSGEVYGFAGPFKYSSPDKAGFISGYFNKKLNWRNYPVSPKEALTLELGRKYIQQNLTGYFYGYGYMIVPHPIVKTNTRDLEKIITLLKTAFDDERNAKKEKRDGTDDKVQKIIAAQKNYFSLDILFFDDDTKTGAISINLMLEEILPSRFRQLFIDAPEKVNNKDFFIKADYSKKDGPHDLKFSFQIIRDFFYHHFPDVINKIFLGECISHDFVFDNIMSLIRKNLVKRKTQRGYVENINLTAKRALMLIFYLQELKIIEYNKNYKYKCIDNIHNQRRRFNLDGFNTFVKENSNLLDSDIKVGIFAVGVLVRFLFDIEFQIMNISFPPFENKLGGYKLNPVILINVYTEALGKIQNYQKNSYVYSDLREIINRYFMLKTHELNKMSNNELSFYFVAGLELGKQFKKEKTDNFGF